MILPPISRPPRENRDRRAAREEAPAAGAIPTADERRKFETETEDGRKIFTSSRRSSSRISPPQLGLKNFQLYHELMDDFNHLRESQLTWNPKCDESVREIRLRFRDGAPQKGGGVHKVEQVVVAPPPPLSRRKKSSSSAHRIITFMAHVDHGKTSLMDAIRKTRRAGRSGRHHPAHRRLHGRSPRHPHHVSRYARSCRVHGDARPRRERDRHRRARGRGGRWFDAANDRSDQPRQGRAACENHGRDQQDRFAFGEHRSRQTTATGTRSYAGLGGETIAVPVSATKGTGIAELLETWSCRPK